MLIVSTFLFEHLDALADKSDTVEKFWFEDAEHNIDLERASAYLHGSKGNSKAKQINMFNKKLVLFPMNLGKFHWVL